MGNAVAAAVIAVLALAQPFFAAGTVAQPVDHYVLALSWSPTYCADRRPSDEPLQCGLDADRTFIVHGLWPNTRGRARDFCDSSARGPSRRTVRDMLAIMPDRGLIRHQWRKHGTCSGLDADTYFQTVAAAAKKVTIPSGLATIKAQIDVRPEVLREAFVRSNPGLSEAGIYVRCRGEDLVDVRLCLTPDLSFRACPNVANRRCRSPMLEIDPPR